MTANNTETSYNLQDLGKRFENWILKHPLKSAFIFGLGTGFIGTKLFEHSIYKAVLKANKETIQLLDWANNQIIY